MILASGNSNSNEDTLKIVESLPSSPAIDIYGDNLIYSQAIWNGGGFIHIFNIKTRENNKIPLSNDLDFMTDVHIDRNFAIWKEYRKKFRGPHYDL